MVIFVLVRATATTDTVAVTIRQEALRPHEMSEVKIHGKRRGRARRPPRSVTTTPVGVGAAIGIDIDGDGCVGDGATGRGGFVES
jgi:hypothetical protein